MKNKKGLMCLVAIFIIGVTNYNYLIAMCFTGVIYAVFRYFQRIKIMNEMNQDFIQPNNNKIMDQPRMEQNNVGLNIENSNLEVDMIIFNDPLTSSQLNNIEKFFEKTVLDRSYLILEIFK